MFGLPQKFFYVSLMLVVVSAKLSLEDNQQLRGTRLLQWQNMWQNMWRGSFNDNGSNDNGSNDNGSWYTRDYTDGQSPQNVNDLGGNRYTMRVAPYEESVKIHSNQYYTGGRFEISLKSASAAPGVITAFYLASSDDVQRSDYDMGSQDEIDFEFIGNDLYNAHTNVFIDGQQQAITVPIGNDHSNSENRYAIEWDAGEVRFYINGGQVRSHALPRPLKPMKMSMAVWTTAGGWQGLKEWAGDMDWESRGNMPLNAEFQVLSFPY